MLEHDSLLRATSETTLQFTLTVLQKMTPVWTKHIPIYIFSAHPRLRYHKARPMDMLLIILFTYHFILGSWIA
jgi:hypothetical protein